MDIYYVLSLYEIPPGGVSEFVDAFQDEGSWQMISRRLPGHLFTHLLRRTINPHSHSGFLTLTFFTSMDAILRAQRSADVQEFIRWLHEHSSLCLHMGIFTFLPRGDPDPQSSPESAPGNINVVPSERRVRGASALSSKMSPHR